MRLLYDNLIYNLQNAGGISTYWYELTRRFLSKKDIDLKFYERRGEMHNMLRKRLELPVNQVLKSRYPGVFIERFLKLPVTKGCHIFHSSYFRVPVKTADTKVVCTVHDFTHDIYYKGPRSWLHNFAKRRAINQSDAIITVSQHTKRDLLNYYPQINASKVTVIYHGASEDFKVLTTEKGNNNVPFFLFVGSREQYKNFNFAVKITEALKKFHLYIVGSRISRAEQQILDQSLGIRYKVLTGLDNIQLNELYNSAFCLLYPSSYEGFGLPVLEAMQAGCPFIALNASSIPEVAGNAGILLNGLNMDEAKEAVDEINANRKSIVEKGLDQAAKFSWDKCFKETYNVYKSLA